MTMIKISDSCYLAADQIAEVRMGGSGTVTVRTKDGAWYNHIASYGTSAYAEFDRIITQINAATDT